MSRLGPRPQTSSCHYDTIARYHKNKNLDQKPKKLRPSRDTFGNHTKHDRVTKTIVQLKKVFESVHEPE